MSRDKDIDRANERLREADRDEKKPRRKTWMAISIGELREWLDTLSDEASIAVDDGGLALVEVGGDTYLEVGGLPLDDETEE